MNDFLTDFGVSEEYNSKELYHLGLSENIPYSEQVENDDQIQSLIETYKNKGVFILAGWIDQAVLEIKGIYQTLELCLEQLDTYRPDQEGDIGIYQDITEKQEILEVGFSKEIGRLWVTIYKKK